MHVLPDFAHVLSFDGNITYASPSVHDLAGYEPSELVGQTFADLIHPEDQLAYLSQFKEVVAQPEAPPLFLYFRLRSKDGSYQLMELTGHARHEPTQQSTASGSAIPSDNKCFFGTARPYPSKNASMVDSFVEHKMENERLKARLARLTAEVGDIAPVEAQRVQMDSQFSKGSRTGVFAFTWLHSRFDLYLRHPSAAVDDALNKTYNKSSAPQQTSTPNLTVSPQFTTLHAPSVRHNAAPPSSVSTLSRPEAAEPSAPSATTITDYSSAVPPANKKSKSRRPAADDNNYVCHDCGTADSPEWRRGPLGPKTLCNACGLVSHMPSSACNYTDCSLTLPFFAAMGKESQGTQTDATQCRRHGNALIKHRGALLFITIHLYSFVSHTQQVFCQPSHSHPSALPKQSKRL